MSRINSFKSYKIEEKITWNQFVIGITMAIGVNYLSSDFKNYNQLRKIYNQINSSEFDPIGKEKEQIEKIRNSVIEDIKSTDLFKKFGKQYVIDSIQNITFKIVDDMSIFGRDGDRTRGCYIYITPLKDEYPISHKFLPSQSKHNVILLNRKFIESKSYSETSETIIHELYHFFDKLIGKNGEHFSTNLQSDTFVDTRAKTDLDYGLDKFLMLNCRTLDNQSDAKKQDIKNQFIDWHKDVLEDWNYLSSEEEVFTRWKTFKTKLLEKGYIQNYTDSITFEVMSEYLYDNAMKKDNDLWGSDEISFLYIIDIKKMTKLDKTIN